MKSNNSEQVTQRLNDWINENSTDKNELFNEIYLQLRDIAHRQLNNASDSRLNTTLLVHELYIEMDKKNKIQFKDRNHFMAISARLIRRFILMELRTKQARKHGGGLKKITISGIEDQLDYDDNTLDLLTVDRLLCELELFDPQSVRIIELRFYLGLNLQEISKALDISTASISRLWSFARSWLLDKLK